MTPHLRTGDGTTPQLHFEPGAIQFAPSDAQEVDGRNLVLEHDEDGGARAVVVGRSLRGVVAEVRGEAGGHRDGTDGAALPLEEERPRRVAASEDAERVGVDGAEAPVVAEVARCAVRRVKLDDIPVELAR